MFFRKKKIYSMDLQQADSTLQNVFAACDRKPNIVSFDKLRLRQQLNTRIYDRILLFIGVLLLLTFLSPFAVSPMTEFLAGGSTEPASLVSDSMAENVLTLTLSGKGILFDQAYQELPDGFVEAPLSYDKKAKTISFSYHAEATVNIYIPVRDQSTLHLVVSPE